MGQAGPHLLAVDDKIIPVDNRPGLQPGQIRAGVGLGIALTPDLFGGQHLGQVALALLVIAHEHQRRPDPINGQLVGPVQRQATLEHLVLINRLLDQIGPAPAPLLGPVQRHIAGLVQAPVPLLGTLPASFGVFVCLSQGVTGIAKDLGHIAVKPGAQPFSKTLPVQGYIENPYVLTPTLSQKPPCAGAPFARAQDRASPFAKACPERCRRGGLRGIFQAETSTYADFVDGRSQQPSRHLGKEPAGQTVGCSSRSMLFGVSISRSWYCFCCSM